MLFRHGEQYLSLIGSQETFRLQLQIHLICRQIDQIAVKRKSPSSVVILFQFLFLILLAAVHGHRRHCVGPQYNDSAAYKVRGCSPWGYPVHAPGVVEQFFRGNDSLRNGLHSNVSDWPSLSERCAWSSRQVPATGEIRRPVVRAALNSLSIDHYETCPL